ncbi:unnamed protein product [marine sediment metagenome]|uniref:Uncharacterized protein n=1 Tax=marine sediment metagenome TaxID=412755 RepID=X1DGJ8_9ZZZZ
MNIKSQLKKWAKKGFKFSGIDRPGVRDGTGPYDPDATPEEIEKAKKNPGSRKGRRLLELERKKKKKKDTKSAGIDRPGVRDRTGPYKPDATKEEKEKASPLSLGSSFLIAKILRYKNSGYS